MSATVMPTRPETPVETASSLMPPHRTVLGVRVHAATYDTATQAIVNWARVGQSRTVCATGAHGVVEAQDDPSFRDVLNTTDLNVPDGMPLVWSLQKLGVRWAERVYGPDLTLHVCRAAAEAGLPVALYGSTPKTLARLREALPEAAPGLDIVCTISPPFRPLLPEEDERYTQQLIDSGARIVLVGLGCPRQERWCAEHRGRIPAVMMAVGAAFDFHAGQLRQAPPRLQRMGLEWAYRLAMEPKRLWRRYARIVPRFIAGITGQMLHEQARPNSVA